MTEKKEAGPLATDPTPNDPTATDISDLSAAARHYIEVHRLALIPLWPATKHPRIKTGVNHASRAVTTTSDIDRYWRTNRNGIAVSGRRNRLAAVDIDGPRGFEKLWDLERIHGRLPITWGLTSNRADEERATFVYTWPDDIEVVATSNKIDGCDKLELKSASSIFVLPPSTHTSGTKYSWLKGVSCCEVELADLPRWMTTITEKAA